MKVKTTCDICYDDIKTKIYKYCDKCINKNYCKSCYKNLILNEFLVCPYCKSCCIIHISIFYNKILLKIKRQYDKCLYKFLLNKQKYGSRNKLVYFNKEIYNNEFILVLNEFYNFKIEILKIILQSLENDKYKTNYTNEIIKALNYVISLKNL